MNYSTVEKLKWANEEQTRIDCEVTFDSIGKVPFTADKNDVMPHGQEIFARCEAGEFGEIAEYAPLSPPKADQPQPIADGAQTL